MASVLWRKTRRDLWKRKGVIAALLAIAAVGIAAYMAMAGVSRDLVQARDQYYIEYRLADFSAQFKRAPAWAIDALASLANVREVRGRVSVETLVELDSAGEPISGRAISMPAGRRPVLDDLLLRSGVWFSSDEAPETILNDAFAKARGLRPGDRVKALLLDKQHDLLVVGTAMSPEFVYLLPPGSASFTPDPARFAVMYLPEAFLRKAADLDGAYNEVLGVVHDHSPEAMQATIDGLERALDPYGVAYATSVDDQPSARYLSDELKGLKAFSKILPTIFLFVAALALNLLLGRMVAQQRPIVGTLKALGFSSGAITRHYLSYGLAIGLAGGICGVGLGFWLQHLYVGLYRQFFALPSIDAHFYARVMLTALLIGVVFSLAGAIQGVRHAARLTPAEAMRPPPPEKAGRILPERFPAFWRRLPFRWKMILRAVFRNPFRSGTAVLASAAAASLIMMAFSNMDSLNYMMRYEFERMARQDVTASLREPGGRRVESEFRNLPTVSAAEAQLTVVCDVAHGPGEKRLAVIGLQRGARMYRPLDSRGGPIPIPSEGLVFSKKLAEILRVKPGDTVRLRPLIAERRDTEAPVVALADTYLGLSAYADIDYLSRLLGEEWVANTLLGQTTPGARRAPLLSALTECPTVIGFSERLRSFHQLEETFGATMDVMIGVLVLFAGLIAFGSVLNATLVSLSEREREVGTLRVLGYSPRQVAGIFSGESLLLNSVGIVFGVALGYGFAHLMASAYSTELYRFPARVDGSSVVDCVLLMLVFIGMAQAIVWRMIRRLPWLEALKVKE